LRELDGSLIVPEHAVDGRSLAALADLVVSAGGTMIREAAVLGTPVWSIFEGRLGAVDELLIAEGRVRFLRDPAELVVEKAPTVRERRGRRDPAELLRLAVPL
jgi:predicted glycosyltransferase